MAQYQFEKYKSKKDERYYWRFVHVSDNHEREVICTGHQGWFYESVRDITMRQMQNNAKDAIVINVPDE